MAKIRVRLSAAMAVTVAVMIVLGVSLTLLGAAMYLGALDVSKAARGALSLIGLLAGPLLVVFALPFLRLTRATVFDGTLRMVQSLEHTIPFDRVHRIVIQPGVIEGETAASWCVGVMAEAERLPGKGSEEPHLQVIVVAYRSKGAAVALATRLGELVGASIEELETPAELDPILAFRRPVDHIGP